MRASQSVNLRQFGSSEWNIFYICSSCEDITILFDGAMIGYASAAVGMVQYADFEKSVQNQSQPSIDMIAIARGVLSNRGLRPDMALTGL